MILSEKEINNILKEKLPNLSQKDMNDFFNITTYKKMGKNKIILKSGMQTKKAFLILDGTVRGYIVDDKGIEITILIRSEGIFVADVRKLFTDQPQRLSFKSIEESHLLLFNYKDFESLANSNSNIMLLYLNILKEGITRLFYRVESLTTMTHEERYKDILALNPNFLNKTNAKYLANYLGITAPSLSRIMKRIKTEKS